MIPANVQTKVVPHLFQTFTAYIFKNQSKKTIGIC